MNICFFSQEYPPETHVGGIGTYTYNMAGALAGLGHTVHVIASTQNSDNSYEDNGVWVHRVRIFKMKLKELALFRYSCSVAKKVSQINCRFDIVQSSEYGSEAFCFSLKKKYPLVTRLATPFFLIEEMNGKVFLGPRPLFNWMEKTQTLRSDSIFTSTRAMANAVADKWGIDPSGVEIIPNSVDLLRVLKLGENKPAPDHLAHVDYVLYFGRLEERKGVHILTEALLPVFKKFPELHAVFVGSDIGFRGLPMKEYMKQKLGSYMSRVIFFDNMRHEDLFPIVNSARMVVLPSLWEAFGFVCVEAMALGRPVIASSGSGFAEIIEEGISGHLVEPGKSGLLAEKMITALKDKEELNRISEGARKRAQDFEVSKVALRLLSYYEKTKDEWLRQRGN